MPKAKNYAGKRFGKLVAIEHVGHYLSSHNKKRLWSFHCDCGRIVVKLMEKVSRQQLKSCGCARSSATPIQTIQHAVYSEYHDGDLSLDDFLFLSQQPCYWCGEFCPTTRKSRSWKGQYSWSYQGLDRINNNQPHNRDNVVPCCFVCNEMKKARTVPQFVEKVQAIYLNRISLLR